MTRKTTTYAEIERIAGTGNSHDEMVGYYRVELTGYCGMMRGHDEALAHFGSFRRNDLTVVYTATVWADYGNIYHHPDSEFCDDIVALRRGAVEWIH